MSHTPICVRTGAHLRPRRPVRITLTSLAAGTLLAVGCNAAQADVQLYGAVDNYVSYDSGGKGSSTQVGSGAGSTSRFGLTGTEDLGGGANVRVPAGIGLQRQQWHAPVDQHDLQSGSQRVAEFASLRHAQTRPSVPNDLPAFVAGRSVRPDQAVVDGQCGLCHIGSGR
ncbi:porin [Pandoraea apista]|nr:porin [Pandoraea apista]